MSICLEVFLRTDSKYSSFYFIFILHNTFFTTLDAVPSKEPLSPNTNVTSDKGKFEPVEDSADGDFIDDDFGLSIKREWEHLRQQQLRIEEEVRTREFYI